jgi:hypothetical protein
MSQEPRTDKSVTRQPSGRGSCVSVWETFKSPLSPQSFFPGLRGNESLALRGSTFRIY